MSQEVFDISEYYRKRVKRGDNEPKQQVLWNDASPVTLTLQPTDNPENYVLWVEELWFDNQSLVFTETVPGDGLMTITFPNEAGDTDIVIDITDFTDLWRFADRQETLNSVNYAVWEFDPPVRIHRSKTKNSMTIAPHTNVSGYTSGTMRIIAKKMWTLKETDY